MTIRLFLLILASVSLSALVYGIEEQQTTSVSREDLLSGVFEIVVRKHIQK